jgi:hypothetical protein
MIRTICIAISLLIAGCSASVATLFIHKQFHAQEQLVRVPMGWPLTFVHQDLSGYTPMSWPQSFRFARPQENPTSVNPGLFAINAVSLAIAIFIVTLLGLRLFRATKRRHTPSADI